MILLRTDPRYANEFAQQNQQKMLDAYDNNYGTEEWDSQERDAMAREAYGQPESRRRYNEGMDADGLRNSGFEEDDIE